MSRGTAWLRVASQELSRPFLKSFRRRFSWPPLGLREWNFMNAIIEIFMYLSLKRSILDMSISLEISRVKSEWLTFLLVL